MRYNFFVSLKVLYSILTLFVKVKIPYIIIF
nr:MAG TPA: hypothetical protein [Bacteriophage sp.]